jgi:hypothetical protein
MKLYYIHYADPGFPDPPWPGQRRSGAFLTLEEATAQAVSDAASGFQTPVGIFHEADSDKLSEHMGETEDTFQPFEDFKTKSAVPVKDVIKKANKIREESVAEVAAGYALDREALASQLPDGVSVDDVLALRDGVK